VPSDISAARSGRRSCPPQARCRSVLDRSGSTAYAREGVLDRRVEVVAVVGEDRGAGSELGLSGGRLGVGAKVIVEAPGTDLLSQREGFRVLGGSTGCRRSQGLASGPAIAGRRGCARASRASRSGETPADNETGWRLSSER
jgi:hypothetical protein